MPQCEICGSENCDYTVDPYQQDVHDNIVMMWLCSDCYRDLAGDI